MSLVVASLLALIAILVALQIALTIVLHRREKRRFERLHSYIWSVANLVRVADPPAPLPEPRGWAASADVIAEMQRTIARQRPELVVEFGSGVSTLFIAMALARNGRGRVISVESSAGYASATRELLEAYGAAAVAEVREAPLVPTGNGRNELWYDMRAIGDLVGIDLAFVDGPWSRIEGATRAPALPFLWERLAPGGRIFVDDARRENERRMVDAWKEQHPEAGIETLHCEKGLVRITKG